MKIDTEFSKYAASYGEYNIIQEKVAKRVLLHVKGEPRSILDLGCGRGAIYEKLSWQPTHFLGVDFAPKMLELHPKNEFTECIYGNFDDPALFEHLQTCSFDYILSASALQWAKDLQTVFANIAQLHAPLSVAIFTSGTFQTLHKTANIPPILRSKEEIFALQKRYFDVNFEVVRYTLEFDSVRELFRYIKKSGVSGSRNLLGYKEMKKLMQEYPLDYLEFEVVFLYS